VNTDNLKDIQNLAKPNYLQLSSVLANLPEAIKPSKEDMNPNIKPSYKN
jgi:hypothetical protein